MIYEGSLIYLYIHTDRYHHAGIYKYMNQSIYITKSMYINI